MAVPVEEPLHSQVLELKNKFLEGLKEIQSKERLKFLEARYKHGASKTSKKEFCIISEETAIKAKNVFKEALLDQSRVRRIGIVAPLVKLIDQFITKGFYHYKHRKPIGNASLVSLNDGEIIHCYSRIIHGLINYYRPVDNLIRVKGLIEGLRRSCCLTLALKHKKPLVWVYTTYSADVKIGLPTGVVSSLPSLNYISNLESKFSVSKDCSFNLDNIIKKSRFRYNSGSRMFS